MRIIFNPWKRYLKERRKWLSFCFHERIFFKIRKGRPVIFVHAINPNFFNILWNILPLTKLFFRSATLIQSYIYFNPTPIPHDIIGEESQYHRYLAKKEKNLFARIQDGFHLFENNRNTPLLGDEIFETCKKKEKKEKETRGIDEKWVAKGDFRGSLGPLSEIRRLLRGRKQKTNIPDRPRYVSLFPFPRNRILDRRNSTRCYFLPELRS